MPPLPNFYVVGTAKCATTSLAQFFEQHPDVCFCEAHEPNFFAFDHYYERGLEAYRQRYRHYGGEKAIGEKSWRYSCAATYPEALPRMLAANPDFKAIYVVRDPLPRAISMWRELRDGGQDIIPADPNVALTTENIVTDSCRYDSQFARFVDALGEENTMIMFYEDFVADPETFYRQICDFLAIEHFVPDDAIHANKSEGQRSDTGLATLLRKSGLDEPLRKLAPAPLRKLARQTLKRPVREIDVTPEAEQEFLALVGEDCGKLIDRAGRDRSMWRLA